VIPLPDLAACDELLVAAAVAAEAAPPDQVRGWAGTAAAASYHLSGSAAHAGHASGERRCDSPRLRLKPLAWNEVHDVLTITEHDGIPTHILATWSPIARPSGRQRPQAGRRVSMGAGTTAANRVDDAVHARASPADPRKAAMMMPRERWWVRPVTAIGTVNAAPVRGCDSISVDARAQHA
jgi:hypothetical protein